MCKRWVSSASCNALPLLDALYVRAMLETADLNTDDEDEDDDDDDDDPTTPRATRSMETQPASRRLSRCSIEMKMKMKLHFTAASRAPPDDVRDRRLNDTHGQGETST